MVQTRVSSTRRNDVASFSSPSSPDLPYSFRRMTSIEMEIVQFLKSSRDAFFARKEIARRARSRSDFEENPHWADAPLGSLVAQSIVVQNDSGHYKLSDKFDG
jgi:hypothetical protein